MNDPAAARMLDQLLVGPDGVATSGSVFFSATDRPEALDPALLRLAAWLLSAGDTFRLLCTA
jgi:SpoVK/Ycf46/Vps4 family AAA+-type ATPase